MVRRFNSDITWLQLMVYVFVLGSAVWFGDASAQTSRSDEPRKKVGEVKLRGTDGNPLIVRMAPSPESDEKANLDRLEREAKTKADNELIKYNGQLAQYTSDLADYTKWLILVGVAQLCVLLFQVRLFAHQEDWMRKHERAYVFGGPASKGEFASAADGVAVQRIPIEVINHGRTPAFVKEVHWGIRVEKDLPDKATYESKISIDHVLSHGQVCLTKAMNECRHDWMDDSHVVYGRVIYEDVFEKRHSSGFIVRVVSNGQGFEYSPVTRNSSYTKWD